MKLLIFFIIILLNFNLHASNTCSSLFSRNEIGKNGEAKLEISSIGQISVTDLNGKELLLENKYFDAEYSFKFTQEVVDVISGPKWFLLIGTKTLILIKRIDQRDDSQETKTNGIQYHFGNSGVFDNVIRVEKGSNGLFTVVDRKQDGSLVHYTMKVRDEDLDRDIVLQSHTTQISL
ncbi:MAG: hypothetical protein V4596_03680 [Bdellovibrionota bacterium]